MTHDEPQFDASDGQLPNVASTKEERTWAMACHLSTFLGVYVPVAPIVGSIVGPLVVWLLKKDEMPLVDDQGKETLNFQISVLIYAFVSGALTLVLIGFVMLVALYTFVLVVTIMGAIKANEGQRYRYPLCIRFMK